MGATRWAIQMKKGIDDACVHGRAATGWCAWEWAVVPASRRAKGVLYLKIR